MSHHHKITPCCCQQLGKIKYILCRCHAINEILREEQQDGQDIEEMMRSGEALSYFRLLQHGTTLELPIKCSLVVHSNRHMNTY